MYKEYKSYIIKETVAGYKLIKDGRESKTYENINDAMEAVDLNKVRWN